jgi:4-carboxymuconolactone decarboxylase
MYFFNKGGKLRITKMFTKYRSNLCQEKKLQHRLESRAAVTEETRYERGLTLQRQLFGDSLEQLRSEAPENQKHIYDYFTDLGFGDFYTRGGLDLKTREMLSLCVLIVLGDSGSQITSHIKANLNEGNNKDYFVDVITKVMPYIGFPRALNAPEIINNLTEDSSR